MKITRRQLSQIIKEELNRLTEDKTVTTTSVTFRNLPLVFQQAMASLMMSRMKWSGGTDKEKDKIITDLKKVMSLRDEILKAEGLSKDIKASVEKVTDNLIKVYVLGQGDPDYAEKKYGVSYSESERVWSEVQKEMLGR